MDLKITGKCFIEQGSDLTVDSTGNRIPAKSAIFCKKRAFIITEDGDIDKFSGEEMDVIYEAFDEDFNFFETQVRELNAERNQSILTCIFRTITGTRHKTRRRQVTSIPSMPITLGVASPTVIPSVVKALATTTVLDTQANAPAATEMEHELSVPETVLPVHPSTNESQLGASYLNICVHQVVQNTNVCMCSSDSYTQENVKKSSKQKVK